MVTRCFGVSARIGIFLLWMIGDGAAAFGAGTYQPLGMLVPEMPERMNILAVGVILLSGLIVLLNKARQKADGDQQEKSK